MAHSHSRVLWQWVGPEPGRERLDHCAQKLTRVRGMSFFGNWPWCFVLRISLHTAKGVRGVCVCVCVRTRARGEELTSGCRVIFHACKLAKASHGEHDL
jgi:hypothetical protein